MKFSCTQENLNQGLFVTGHVAGKNTNLPILSNVILQTKEGGLKLSTTNLEIGISYFMRAKVENEGDFTVPAKILSDYINLLPRERIDIEKEDQNLNVVCNNYKTKIRGMAAVDFPLIPQIEKRESFICEASVLREALGQVIFAVSANESRPEIGGVLFKFLKDNTLILTSTDSYRLAEKRFKLVRGPKNETKVIVPAKTMQELLRILSGFKKEEGISGGEENENLEIYLGENQILFVYGEVELVSRLVEGQYPDYEQIIPKNYKTKTKISINELVKAVKTASLFSRSGIYDINLNFLPPKNKLIISSVNNQLGENISEIDADIKGEENDIILNFRYLLDGLNNISGNDVYFETAGPDAPCLIKPTEKDDYLYILMPIKQ